MPNKLISNAKDLCDSFQDYQLLCEANSDFIHQASAKLTDYNGLYSIQYERQDFPNRYALTPIVVCDDTKIKAFVQSLIDEYYAQPILLKK